MQQFVRRRPRLLLERIACPHLYMNRARERIPVRVGCDPYHGPPSLDLVHHLGDAIRERCLHLIYTSSRHSRALLIISIASSTLRTAHAFEDSTPSAPSCIHSAPP